MSPSLAQRGVDRAEQGLRRVRRLRFDRQYRRDADHALNGLAESLGRRPSAAQRAECEGYAREVLGSAAYAPWLEVYTTMQGRFREGWIPDNYFGWHVVPALARGLGGASSIRTLTGRLLGDAPLPDVAHIVDGRLRDRSMAVVDEEAFVAALAREHEVVVVKRDATARSTGVRVVRTSTLDAAAIAATGNGVVQYRVRQHPSLERLVPGPVATLRLTTVIEPDGGASMRSAILRLGRRADDVLRPGQGGVTVSIGPDGRLLDRGLNSAWHLLPDHPDSGAVFAGVEVPSFGEAVRLATALHDRIPHLGVIGWDLAVDERGDVLVLEWNILHPGIQFAEAVEGPCFTGLGWESIWRRPGQ